ncbi:MAG: type IV pilus assembly protein PilM [bacterium]|nr:type IV pilus assembly protein PilM [bacterium]
MNFFPTSIGLDISENSIKAVALKKGDKGLFDLVAFGKGYLPEGAFVDGEIKNEGAFLEVLNTLIASEKSNFPKTKYLVVSLPEEKAFLRVVELPLALKDKELESALKFEVESNLPLALDEIYYGHEILNTNVEAGHYDIMVQAVPKKIADAYTEFFKKNGYVALALELESAAAARSLFPKKENKDSILVLDIGSTQTRFMIVSEGILRFTSSNTVAGNQFSKTLSEHFPVNLKEAEFMKRMVGLDKNQEKGKELLEALRPSLESLKDQIQNYLTFFETHPASHYFSEGAKKISKIVLTGGGACLWGIADWLNQEVGLSVVLANPISRININPHSKIKLSLEESLPYTSAIGLALRNFEEIK